MKGAQQLIQLCFFPVVASLRPARIRTDAAVCRQRWTPAFTILECRIALGSTRSAVAGALTLRGVQLGTVPDWTVRYPRHRLDLGPHEDTHGNGAWIDAACQTGALLTATTLQLLIRAELYQQIDKSPQSISCHLLQMITRREMVW